MSLFRKLVGIFQAAGVALRKRLLGGLPPVYVEDVFSTYLYTGTGATQTITNSIDTTTYGGLVWIKRRSAGTSGHRLTDTSRGVTKSLTTNSTAIEATEATGLTAFGTTGFTIGADTDYNASASTYASWTFRKQAKFFDIVTYTGTGSVQNISHNLGSVPAFMIIKSTTLVGNWTVYHRSLGNDYFLSLNAVNNATASSTTWNNTTPTSTVFTVGTSGVVNTAGETFVAYLYAHDAGGFGLTGTDNVISCGSYVGNGSTSGPIITLGYEPQWVLIKLRDASSDWYMNDVMREMSNTNERSLYANTSAAEENAAGPLVIPTATGFTLGTITSGLNQNGSNYIYIAIRRGPMKVPTSGTSVFSPVAYLGGTADLKGGSNGFPTDLIIDKTRDFSQGAYWSPRLTDRFFLSSSTDSDTDNGTTIDFDVQSGANLRGNLNFGDPISYIAYFLKRAPSFMDVVCYTGTGSNTTVAHNLQAVPELIICKRRNSTGAWDSYSSALANTEYVVLNTTAAKATGATRWNSTTPTSSVFSVGTSTSTNANTGTYVAYLFATCAGVSKVGSYTGTATTLQIDCGFTAGARFVMIKRTDSTGDWYVWDTARGIIAGNDPYLLLNSAGAEATATDYIDPYSPGFELSSTAPAAINANGGTYIFLAIA